MALALLACIGQIKGNPLLSWSPVDLTLLVAAIVIAAAVRLDIVAVRA